MLSSPSRTVSVLPGFIFCTASASSPFIIRLAAGFMPVGLPSKSQVIIPIGEASISRLRNEFCSCLRRRSLRRLCIIELNISTSRSASLCPTFARRLPKSCPFRRSIPLARVVIGRTTDMYNSSRHIARAEAMPVFHHSDTPAVMKSCTIMAATNMAISRKAVRIRIGIGKKLLDNPSVCRDYSGYRSIPYFSSLR